MSIEAQRINPLYIADAISFEEAHEFLDLSQKLALNEHPAVCDLSDTERQKGIKKHVGDMHWNLTEAERAALESGDNEPDLIVGSLFLGVHLAIQAIADKNNGAKPAGADRKKVLVLSAVYRAMHTVYTLMNTVADADASEASAAHPFIRK
jgi:hypothetical protein